MYHEKPATFLKTVSRLLSGPILSLEAMILKKDVPNSALSSKAANRKQIGTQCFQQPGGKEVCFFFHA